MKVKLNDAVICRKIFNDILILISILGGIALFDTDLIQNNACTVILVCSSFILGDYIVLLYSANNLKNISLKIANSNFEIRVGDLFEEQGLKVINFNEYFDTLIDNQIIAEKSLNGFFIKNKLNIKVDKLNEIIEQQLQEMDMIDTNEKRKSGKKIDINWVQFYHTKNTY